MIVSEIFYGVKCNRCDEMYDDGEHTFWNYEDTSIEQAIESEWIEQKNKHYCPNCYDYDEGKDENVIREEFPLHLKQLKKFINKITRSYTAEVLEDDDLFQISAGLYNSNTLTDYEENYIKQMLGDKLISFEYQKHERYTRYDCIIKIKKG